MHTVFDLLEQAQTAVVEMLQCKVEWDVLRPLPNELPTDFVARFDDPERACDAALRESREPRADAVASHRAKLQALWTGGLEALFFTHCENPNRLRRRTCRVHPEYCFEQPTPLSMCEWGCPGCCEAVLADLRQIEMALDRSSSGASRQRAPLPPELAANEISASEITGHYGVPGSTLQDWTSKGKRALPILRRTHNGTRVFDRNTFLKTHAEWQRRRRS